MIGGLWRRVRAWFLAAIAPEEDLQDVGHGACACEDCRWLRDNEWSAW